MTPTAIASIIGFLLFGAAVLWVIKSWLARFEEKTKPSQELIAWMQELGRRIDYATANTDRKLSSSMDMFNTRLDKAAHVIGSVQKSIGEFSEIGRSMKDLQDLLQSPKLRGNIGEHVLKELLAQYLPPSNFRLQHTFASGEKVDAVIRTSQGLIPIDAKFPLSAYRLYTESETDEDRKKALSAFMRDVKKHLNDISQKYILTAEGTVDYAIMYVPSETVYYEIINSAELFDLSNSQRVLPVSPLGFYAYLRAILMSFEGQRIQEEARKILTTLQAIRKDYEKTEYALSVLTKHVTNAHNQAAAVRDNFSGIGQKLTSIELTGTATLSENTTT